MKAWIEAPVPDRLNAALALQYSAKEHCLRIHRDSLLILSRTGGECS